MPRRPASFGSNEITETLTRFGPNPANAFQVGAVDNMLRRGLNGETGAIIAGDKQTGKYTGPLLAQQQFFGIDQLTNLVNTKQRLPTAMPASKPNPGVVPLTQMQSLLASMNSTG